MAVASGQGRGPTASYAAETAVACIGAGLDRPFAEMFTACDARLRGSCGVALAIAVVELDFGRLTTAAVGCVRTLLLTAGANQRFAATQGVVGGSYQALVADTTTLCAGDVLLLCSAGVEDLSEVQKAYLRSASCPSEHALLQLDGWARPDADAALLIYRHQA